MSRVLILADSRGSSLPGLLNENHSNIRFDVKCYPGASIGVLRGRLIDAMKNADGYKMVVIFGGICSVTKIQFIPYRAAVVRCVSPDDIVREFTSECDDLMLVADNLPLPVVLAPFVGVDLIKYAGHYNKMLYDMQKIVDVTIPRINIFIKGVNDTRGLTTPNISSCIHRCRGKGKGYRTHYMKLPDGCHPSEEVNAIWAHALVDCCQLNLQEMGK